MLQAYVSEEPHEPLAQSAYRPQARPVSKIDVASPPPQLSVTQAKDNKVASSTTLAVEQNDSSVKGIYTVCKEYTYVGNLISGLITYSSVSNP